MSAQPDPLAAWTSRLLAPLLPDRFASVARAASASPMAAVQYRVHGRSDVLAYANNVPRPLRGAGQTLARGRIIIT
ncbi:hypothetical protein [Roseimaritima ulvae]|uniref:hypothetical protein n=1 Tax=Roseimaritima ulvae TaxID=980254 RepID=UPI0011CE77AB|nr:hypothetical protein [Roseimaritima ulvae]